MKAHMISFTLVMAVLALLITAAMNGEITHSIGYIVLTVLVFYILKQSNIPASQKPLLPAILLLGTAGWTLGLYSSFGLYNKILHLAVPAIMSWLLGSIFIKSICSPATKSWVLVLVIASSSLALAACWEIVEWLAMTTTDYVMGDLNDTVSDLILDLIGSIAGAWLAYMRRDHLIVSRRVT